MTEELSLSLAGEINAAYLEAQSHCDNVAESGRLAVRAAIRCGAHLETLAQHLKANGSYLKWLSDNTQISASTAERWRKLAKSSHVTNLENAASIRQAYLLTGIIPPVPRGDDEHADGGRGGFSFVSYLKKSDRWLDSYFEKHNVEVLPLSELEVIADQLEKSAKRYAEVAEQIKKRKADEQKEVA